MMTNEEALKYWHDKYMSKASENIDLLKENAALKEQIEQAGIACKLAGKQIRELKEKSLAQLIKERKPYSENVVINNELDRIASDAGDGGKIVGLQDTEVQYLKDHFSESSSYTVKSILKKLEAK